MQTILLEDRLFEIPSNYNEATPEQIRTIVRLDTQRMSEPTRFFLITMCLMNVSKSFWLRFRWFFRLKTAETLLEMGDFRPEMETFLNNPIPFYQQKFPILGRFRKLFGPGDALENITFRQFRQAEELSYQYSQFRQEHQLDELLSVLYLRKSYAKFWRLGVVDRLTTLDEKKSSRLDILSTIPMDTKQAIFLWYLGSRSVLMRQFPRIFQSSGKTEPVQEKNAITSQKIGESYAKLLDGLAETAPNYGPWDATSIYDVLNNYQEKLFDSDRIKERNNK